MLIINQNFNKSMEVGTEKCLLSRVDPKLTAYLTFECLGESLILGKGETMPIPEQLQGF